MGLSIDPIMLWQEKFETKKLKRPIGTPSIDIAQPNPMFDTRYRPTISVHIGVSYLWRWLQIHHHVWCSLLQFKGEAKTITY